MNVNEEPMTEEQMEAQLKRAVEERKFLFELLKSAYTKLNEISNMNLSLEPLFNSITEGIEELSNFQNVQAQLKSEKAKCLQLCELLQSVYQ